MPQRPRSPFATQSLQNYFAFDHIKTTEVSVSLFGSLSHFKQHLEFPAWG